MDKIKLTQNLVLKIFTECLACLSNPSPATFPCSACPPIYFFIGTSAIPHSGHIPAIFWRTLGCIGQVYIVSCELCLLCSIIFIKIHFAKKKFSQHYQCRKFLIQLILNLILFVQILKYKYAFSMMSARGRSFPSQWLILFALFINKDGYFRHIMVQFNRMSAYDNIKFPFC